MAKMSMKPESEAPKPQVTPTTAQEPSDPITAPPAAPSPPPAPPAPAMAAPAAPAVAAPPPVVTPPPVLVKVAEPIKRKFKVTLPHNPVSLVVEVEGLPDANWVKLAVEAFNKAKGIISHTGQMHEVQDADAESASELPA